MWLIDRTWKPREGWSRPALTVEDNQHHHDEAGKPRRHHGGTNTKSLTRVHDPVPEPPPADRITDFAAAMAQGRRPVTIPNPEAKPWHGDGTMPERTWESSTPPQPHFTEGPGNTRSPGLPRIPGTTQNPRHGHRRTGGAYHTARSSSHEHPSKPEEQQLPTIFSPPTCLQTRGTTAIQYNLPNCLFTLSSPNIVILECNAEQSLALCSVP